MGVTRVAMADQGRAGEADYSSILPLAERRGKLCLERHECGRREADLQFRGIEAHRWITGGRHGSRPPL